MYFPDSFAGLAALSERVDRFLRRGLQVAGVSARAGEPDGVASGWPAPSR